MKEGYIPQEKRKKILLLCDDIRMTSGISTMAREIVIGTAHKYNWVNIGGAIQHPDKGKRFDLNADTNTNAGIEDASVYLYPVDGYGSPELIRQMMQMEKPDAIMIFTDPRYWTWLFQMEQEIRKQIPLIYLNIWDDLPYPMYNKSYYESCDTLLAISKQTENLNKAVLGPELSAEKVIKYVPHGINEKFFFPINTEHPEYLALQEFKKQLYGEKNYDFNLLYNARNIRRKSVPDLMLAWKIFIDKLTEEQAKKCVLTLHTQPVDDNGTDLPAVQQMLFGNDPKYQLTLKCHHNHTVRVYDKNGELRLPEDVYSNIKVIKDEMAIEDLVALHQRHHVLIYPTWGEGFGFIPLQALATGMPVISTYDWAHYKKFMGPLKLRSTLTSETLPKAVGDAHVGQMFKPDEKHLEELMHDSILNFKAYSGYYFAQSTKIHEEYNWIQLTNNAFDHIFKKFQ